LEANNGEQGPCGWLKDKYGLSWQINPRVLGEMLSDPDPAKAKRAMEAMLSMKKIDTEGLKGAYDQRGFKAEPERPLARFYSSLAPCSARSLPSTDRWQWVSFSQ
jgi:hypothetical protein